MQNNQIYTKVTENTQCGGIFSILVTRSHSSDKVRLRFLLSMFYLISVGKWKIKTHVKYQVYMLGKLYWITGRNTPKIKVFLVFLSHLSY